MEKRQGRAFPSLHIELVVFYQRKILDRLINIFIPVIKFHVTYKPLLSQLYLFYSDFFLTDSEQLHLKNDSVEIRQTSLLPAAINLRLEHKVFRMFFLYFYCWIIDYEREILCSSW